MEVLARMVAEGFDDVGSRMALKSETATKQDLIDLERKLDKKIDEVKSEVAGLRNSVNNYLKLSDRRYLELKNEQKVLARYLKVVIQKANIAVDMKDLEMILKY